MAKTSHSGAADHLAITRRVFDEVTIAASSFTAPARAGRSGYPQRSIQWARRALLLLAAAAAALVCATIGYGIAPSDLGYFAGDGLLLVVLP
jgi:hypothetical protein